MELRCLKQVQQLQQCPHVVSRSLTTFVRRKSSGPARLAHTEHCNCANSQVTASRKAFSPRDASVSYMQIIKQLCSCNWSLFLVSEASATATNYTDQCLMYMEIANLSILHDSHVKMATQVKLHDRIHAHGDASVRVQCVSQLAVCTIAVPCRPHCYACAVRAWS